MNIIQRMLRKAVGYGGGITLDTTDPRLAQFFGNSTYAGKSVTPDTAMQQATVFTCVRIIAETFGSLPAHIVEVDSAGNAQPVDHDLGAVLFETPNADMTSVEFEEAKTTNLALQGNAYCYRNVRGDGQISSLYPIASDCVEKKRKDDGTIFFRVNDRGRWETLPQDRIWHVPGFGFDGLKGYSPIGYLRQMLGMAMATEEWQARFFSNGAQPSFFLTIPQFLNKEQRKAARESLQNVFAGPANAYKAQLLEGGITATPATMNMVDAQFLQLKGSTKQDIFGMYRIPPHMGGDLERSTNNNIEQQALEFVMYCLLPYATRYERSATRWLFTPKDRKRFKLRYNMEGLLRADSQSRALLYASLLDHGVLNRNEVRALEGRNRSPVAGMDDYTIQTAMAPIDTIRKIAERSAQPSPPPAVTPLPGSPKKRLHEIVVDDRGTELIMAGMVKLAEMIEETRKEIGRPRE